MSDILDTARAILDGHMPDGIRRPAADWIKAAEYALDGDDADLAYMLDLDAGHDLFVDWCWRTGQQDSDPDFFADEWIAKARAAESYVPAGPAA